MVIQLDRILEDISKENVLHPNFPNADKKSLDDAWDRVGNNNKLTKHEVRSIFKVLQKKYDQEKLKPHSTWRLFDLMDEIHNKTDFSAQVKEENDSDTNNDEEEYEMFDVQEEEEAAAAAATSTTAEAGGDASNETDTYSEKSGNSPEKATAVKPSDNKSGERKFLNAVTKSSPPAATATSSTSGEARNNAAPPALMQKKGITLKKTLQVSSSEATASGSSAAGGGIANKPSPRTLQTSSSKIVASPKEATKRRFTDEPTTTTPVAAKRPAVNQVTTTSSTINRRPLTTTTAASPAASSGNQVYADLSPQSVKKEEINSIGDLNSPPPAMQQSQLPTQGINIITIPAMPTRADLTNGILTGGGGPSSSTAATVASNSTNGYSPPRIEDIDFRNDIIFDPNGINMNVNNSGAGPNAAGNKLAPNAGSIVNLGNFDNSLPPTFFKNLCNSSRHEALGLYVANVMNRLSTRSAAKLELNILRAVIDAQSDELEQ